MVAEKSNEIPTAPELIEALGLKNRLFTLDAEHCQKRMARPVCKRLDRRRRCSVYANVSGLSAHGLGQDGDTRVPVVLIKLPASSANF